MQLRGKIITIIFLLLLTISFARADFQNYPQYGNAYGNTYNFITSTALANDYTESTYASSGQDVQPTVYDLDKDNVQEILFTTTGGVLNLVSGASTTGIIDSLVVGTPQTTGAICDVNNDGVPDYVSVYDNGTTANIVAIDVINKHLTPIASQIVNDSNYLNANIACGQFYLKQGDNKYYAAYLDTNKGLYIGNIQGGAWSITRHEFIAVTSEAPYDIYQRGSHTLIFSNNFDPSGNGAFIFANGRRLFAYSSDDHIVSADFNSTIKSMGYSPNSAVASLMLFGNVVSSRGGSESVVLAVTGDSKSGASTPLLKYAMARNILGIRSLVLNGNISTTQSSGVTSVWSQIAVGDYNNDGVSDIFSLNEMPSPGGSTFDIIRADTMTSVRSMSAAQLSSYLGTNFPVVVGTARAAITAYVGDFEKNNKPDFIVNYRGTVLAMQGSTNYTSALTLFNITGVTAGEYATPVPVDYNKDGTPEFIWSVPSATQFYASTTGNVKIKYPFSITLNNTLPLQSVQKITAGFNSSNFFFDYAVACDLSQATIWNEQFKNSYNFTKENVTFNVYPPESFLTLTGFQYTINGTFPQFDLYKTANTGVRDVTSEALVFSNNDNASIDLITYGSDSQVTSYFRFNKTSNIIKVSKIFLGADPINVFNFTIVNGKANINIIYTPNFDVVNNVEYYDVVVQNGNVTAGTTTTYQYTGTDIKDVELYSDTPSTILLTQLGFFKTHNAQPSFTGFQNTYQVTQNGVTVTVPGADDNIAGNGFTTLLGNNNVFYSVCSYAQAGTYTQRHYLVADNIIDYSNYHDLTVTVGNATTDANGNVITPTSGDPVQNVVDNWLSSVGMGSVLARLLVGLIVLVIVLAGIFYIPDKELKPIFKILLGAVWVIAELIGGYFLHIYPFWVILMMILFCAGVVGMFWKKVTSDTQGG